MTATGRRAGLDYDDVVAAALALVEEGGAEALSMRKLAADLGVATTTIYWHVGNRDELILAVIARFSEREAARPIEGTTPRERAMSVAMQVWQSAMEHRNVAALAHHVGATPVLGHPMELALARELDACGLKGPAARDALRAILMCVAGFLVFGLRGEGGDTSTPSLWTDVVDDHIDPETVQAMAVPADLPALFQTTLQAVVDSVVPDPAEAA